MTMSLYERFIRALYPFDYAAAFATEMCEAYEHRLNECGRRFIAREFASLLRGAALEWTAKLTTDKSVRGRCLPDIRMMRPAGVAREIWFTPPKC